jgi:HupE / UreJ protein
MSLMRLGALLVAALAATPSLAHKPSDAYLTLQPTAQGYSLRVDVALRDLDRELHLDSNDDGNLSWGEVRQRWPAMQNLVQATVVLQRGGQPCVVAADPSNAVASHAPQLAQHSDGAYAVLQQRLVCQAASGDVGLRYQLFASSDATHRGLLRVTDQNVLVLDPSAQSARMLLLQRDASSDGTSQAITGGFVSFLIDGMKHIAAGLDHILFLVTLLLVTVLHRQARAWEPVAQKRTALWEALRVVTAFTVAHSLTLSLAVMGWIDIPSRWVESLIALSVLLAAVDNLVPFLRAPRWVLVGLFGCVHGLGFAGPLQALGLQGTALLVPLLGFNVGVELGQLVLLLLLMPALMAWRATKAYRRVIVPVVSVGVAALATLWLVERSLDIRLLT